jgi:hypothetical protein
MAVRAPTLPQAAALLPLQLLASLADRLRARLLGRWGRLLRPVLQDRRKRAAGVAVAIALFSLAMAGLFPVWLLVFGPLVWGVPHLLSDLRYLLVRQGLQRERLVMAIGGATLLVAAFSELGVRATLIGAAVLALVIPGQRLHKLLLAAVLLSLVALAWPLGWTADLLFAHGHNAIALAIWWFWRPRRGWLVRVPLIAALAGLGLLLGGALDPWMAQSGPTESLNLDELSWQLAPLDDEVWSRRWTASFAFAQAIHYAVWIHLLPSDDRAREVPRSFQNSLKALEGDMGWPLIALAALLALALALTALLDLGAARDRYFQLAWFHGHVELLAAVWLLLRGVTRAELHTPLTSNRRNNT